MLSDDAGGQLDVDAISSPVIAWEGRAEGGSKGSFPCKEGVFSPPTGMKA